ncbi:hypothetical protein [Vibrio crassostreae]|uniref:hypothetical protein n=1 Tax=Vibrio crassostreae TaxID=246167 RepID=UPI001B308B12|nr:hypothetical protein [Vibrio crassostreae]
MSFDYSELVSNIASVEAELSALESGTLSDDDVEVLENYKNSLENLKTAINLNLENNISVKQEQAKELRNSLSEEFDVNEPKLDSQPTPFDSLKTPTER